MNTMATAACPQNSTSQGTTEVLKYLWTEWPKIPVHTATYLMVQRWTWNTRGHSGKGACPHHTSTYPEVQLRTCDTSRPQWNKVAVHILWYNCGFVTLVETVAKAYPSFTVKVFSTVSTSLGFVCVCVCVCERERKGESEYAICPTSILHYRCITVRNVTAMPF
jgi:hypothetical protein